MTPLRPLVFATAIVALPMSCCDDTPILTQEVFVEAVKKCKPIDARFIMGSRAGARPSVEFTVPSSSSTIPDCMAKQFGEARPKHIRINYAPAS